MNQGLIPSALRRISILLCLSAFPIYAFLYSQNLGEYRSDASTVGLWHFNETSGSAVADSSGLSNNGTATGTTIVDGRFGKERSFNGSSDYVTLPSTIAPSSITLEAWIYLTGAGNDPTRGEAIITKEDGHGSSATISWRLYVDPVTFKLSTFMSNGTTDVRPASRTALVFNKRYHVAASYDGSTVRLFINGALDTSIAASLGALNSTTSLPLTIGGMKYFVGGTLEWFQGFIDEVRISNIARSPNEFNLQLPSKNLTATPSGTTINLSWQNGGGAVPLMRYKVYRGTDSTSVSLIDSTTSTAYPNSGLAIGTYYYRVSAVDSTGFEGARSYSASATVNTAPTAPQNLAAIAGSNQVTLRWNKNTEADFLRYRIYQGTSPNPTTKVDSTSGGNASDTSKTIAGLTNGTTYYFRITSVDSAGNESGYSNEINIMPFGFPLTIQPGPVEGKDSYVSRDNPTTSYGSSEWLSFGGTPVGGVFPDTTYLFIQFDLAQILPVTPITTARIDFHTVGSNGYMDYLYGVYQATQPWNETTITWNNRPSFSPFAVTTFSGNSWQTYYQWHSVKNLKDLVQDWVDNPLLNFGIVIKPVSASYGTPLIHSSDYMADSSLRPRLVINSLKTSIVGTVRDQLTGGPIMNAVVGAYQQIQYAGLANFALDTTDVAGSYELILDVPGSYDIKAEGLNGYLGTRANGVSVSEGNTTIQNLNFYPNSHAVGGNVSGQWSKSGSPYVIAADVEVTNALTIDPGVQVLFAGRYRFTIKGTLTAIGLPTDSILFSRYYPTDDSRGYGIKFLNASNSSRMQYCRVEYGLADDGIWGANAIDDYGGGIYLENTTANIQNCLIQNNQGVVGGGICINGGSPLVKSNAIKHNSALYAGYVYQGGGGLYLMNSSAIIENNFIYGNSYNGGTNFDGGAGIYTMGGNSVIRNNLVVRNTTNLDGAALYSYSSSPVLENNTVFGNSGRSVLLVNGREGGSPSMVNSIVWQNSGIPVDFNYGGSISISYSNIQGGFTGVGNINIDPLFVDTSALSFYLANGSLCIDAGNATASYNDNCLPPSMGLSRNDMGVYGGPKACDPIPIVFAIPGTPILVFPEDNATNSPTTLSFQWNPASNATNYHVQVARNSAFTIGIALNDSAIGDTYKTVSGLSYGTRYYWRVRTLSSDGSSSFSATRTFVTASSIAVEPPNAPRILSAAPASVQVTLRWNKNTEPDFFRYRIYGGTSPNPTTKIDSMTAGTNDTSKVIGGLTNGTTHYFRITAVDSAGNESGYSNEVSATPNLVADGLVAYYPFNGNASDESGNGNNATVNGATLTTDRFGNVNTAFNFNGGGDYIDPATLLSSVQDNFSVSVWVKPTVPHEIDTETDAGTDGTSNQKYVLWPTHGNGFGNGHAGMGISAGTNGVSVYEHADGYMPAILVSQGVLNGWTQVTVVYINKQPRLYLNDSLVRVGRTSTMIVHPSTGRGEVFPSQWGGIGGGSYGSFPGVIDDIRIYGRPLTEAEIQTLYLEDGYNPPPQAPRNLMAQSGNGQVMFTWSPNTEPDLLRYRIYGGTSPNPTSKVDSTTGGISDTTKIITGLTNGNTYYFRITAVDSAGNESGYSNEVSATPFVLSAQKEYTPDANTVLLLHMNETSGSVVSDASIYGNNGTAIGTTIVDGRFGKSRKFTTSDSINIPDSPSLNLGSGDFTIEFWINSGIAIGNPAIKKFDGTTGYRFGGSYGGAGSTVSLGLDGGGQAIEVWSQDSVNDGKWHHVAGLRTGSRLKLYLDGVLQDDIDASNIGDISNARAVYIGHTDGSVDEVRISNKARQPNEFNLQLPPKNLTASNNPYGQVVLSWQNGGGAVPLKYYKLYRGMDSTNVSFLYSTTSTSMPDGDVGSGTTYYYRVSAVDSTDYEGAKSFAVKITTPLLLGEYTTDTNTVLLLHMNETSGSIVSDASSYGNNGTATGTTIVDGGFGLARYFNGSSDSVVVPHSASLLFPNAFTFEAWIMFETGSGNGRIISKQWNGIPSKALELGLQGSGSSQPFYLLVGNAGVYSATNLSSGRRYHVAATYDRSVVRLYVNGKLDTLTALTEPIPQVSTTLLLGRSANNPWAADFFKGIMDEVRISNIARSPNEFNLQLPPKNLTAAASGTTINLGWQNGGGAVSLMRYKIYRGTDSSNVVLIDSTINTSFSNSGLSGGIRYFYRVSAVDSSGFEGAKSYAIDSELVPTITSFSPTSGPIGTSVTITGTNFNTTAGANKVYFGAVKAAVSSAASTSLTVAVPVGATFAPITVTDTSTGLTAYSTAPFVVTFTSSRVIDVTSFAAKVDFTPGTSPCSVAIGDIDGDGKPDLVVTNANSSTVSVFRNTSASGFITGSSFAAKADFTTGTNPRGVAIGDVDGDGKPDLVIVNTSSSNTVSVFRNTSTVGSITTGSFASKVDFTTGTDPVSVAIGDVDGDGKPDLVVANPGNSTVSVLRNTSTSGSITASSFASKVDFATGAGPYSVAIGDVDGDGKPDLVVTNLVYGGSSTVSVFRNTSTSGSITAGSFASKVDFTTGMNPESVVIGDVDGDGKPDLVIANSGNSTVSVFRNTSTSGSITAGSLASKVDFTPGTNPRSVAIGDVDGDGKPDLAVANNTSNTVSVFRNTSTSGSITTGSFAVKVDFTPGTNPWSVAIGDIDGDGKPDLAVANYNSNTVSVLRNVIPRLTAPKNLTAVAGNGQATLQWSKSADFNLLRYRIYRGTSSPASTLIDSTSAGNLNDSARTILGLINGTTYYFRVTAVDSAVNESGYSNEVSATPTVLNAAREYNPDVNTVLLFHMNETSGSTVSDASNFGNTGTTIGTSIANGKFSNARYFNGTSDRITIPSVSVLNVSPTITLEAWIQPSGFGGNNMVIRKNGPNSQNGYFLGFASSGSLLHMAVNTAVGLGTSTPVSPAYFLDGRRHHIAGTYDGQKARVYVDGVFQNEVVFGVSIGTNSTDPVSIGANDVYGEYFSGMIDEIRISNIARSPNEFNLQLPPKNLSATPSATTVNLTWQNGGGAVPLMRYKIYRGGDSTNVALIDSTTSASYANVGLTSATTYFYRVSAVDSTGFEGAKSYAAGAATANVNVLGEYVSDANTVVLLHMNETSGTTVSDASGNGHDGTASGTTTVDGRFGKARSFNGIDESINLAYNGNFGTGPFTVEFWVNLNSLSANHQNIIGNRLPQGQGTWWIGVFNDGGINVDGGSGTITSGPGEITAAKWYHIAVSRDNASVLTIYKNGQAVGSGSQTGDFSGGTTVAIGAIFNGGEHTNGVIDEVRISNIARSPTEFNLQLAPKNLSPTSSANAVSLSWQNGGGAVPLMRYRVYRGGDSTNVALVDSTASTSYVNSGLASGTRYFYRVSAVDSSGFESGQSYAAATLTFTGPGEYVADANTVLLMHMNESSGSSLSDAGNYGNNGSATGTSVINGRFGKARNFNGASEFIQIPHSSSLNISSAITVEAWVYDAGVGGIHAWASKYDPPSSWDIHSDAFFVSRDGIENDGLALSAPKNAWTHVACVYDGQQQRVYVNGVLTVSRSWPGSMATNTNPVFIGTHGNQYWQGYIDEVRISNIARSPNEFDLQLPPVNLNTSVSGAIVTVNWQNGGGAIPVMKYRVYRGSDSTNVLLIDSTASTSLTNIGLAGGRYFYRMSAVDSTGFEGGKSYAVSAVVVQNIGEYRADASTVLLLHMNETSGTTVSDASSFGNNGTAVGTTIFNGRFGKARSFNGTSDVINTNYNGNFGTSPFTVEFWVYLNSPSSAVGHQNIIGNRFPQNSNTWWVGVFDGGSINVDGGSGQNVSNPGDITTGRWYHIAVSRNASNVLTVYKNGVVVKTGTQSGNLSGGTNLAIGAIYNGAEYVNGLIDEVRISSVARSSVEFDVPLPPKNFSAIVSASTANLSWQNGGGVAPVMRYRIYRGLDSSNVVLLDSTATTTYSDLGLALGTYFYRLSAIDSTGFEGEKSYAAAAAVLGTPAIPSLAYPGEGSGNQNIRPRVGWNSSPSATKYHLQVSQNSNFSTTIFDDTTLTDTFRQVGTLQNNRTFYWRVRANNAAGWSASSQPLSFSTTRAPDISSISVRSSFLSPGSRPRGVAWDGENLWMLDNLKNIYKMDTSGNVLKTFSLAGFPDSDLSWDGTGLWVGGAANGSRALKVDTNGIRIDSVAIHYSNGGFEWDGKFFWAGDYNSSVIHKHNRAGTEILNYSASSIFGHATGISYDGVNLWIGGSGEGLTEDIVKYSTTGQQQYKFDLSTIGISAASGSFASIAWDGQSLWYASDDQFTIYRLNVPYFYQTPSVPVLVSPTDSVIEQPVSVALSWQPSPDASTYRLQVSTSSSFSSLVYDDSTLTGTSHQVGSLTPGIRYYWRVRAKNSGGSSQYSNARNFTTFQRLLGEYTTDAGTVLLLHMNEQSGSTIYDASSYQNNGTATGTTVVDGRFGKGRSFGVNEVIRIPGSSLTSVGGGDFSLEFWIKASGSSGPFLYKWAYETTGGFNMNIAGGTIEGQLLMTFNDNSGPVKNAVSARRIDDNTWHHIAAIRSGNSMTMYVDGVIEIVVDITGEGSFANNDDLGLSALIGVMDELRVSNRARTPSEFNLQLPPRNLSVLASGTTLNLSWQNGGGVSPLHRYMIYRGADSLNVILIDSSSSASYQNTGLPSGTRYYYRTSSLDSTRFEGGKSYAVEGITVVLRGEYASDTATVLLLHMNDGTGTTVGDVGIRRYTGSFGAGSFVPGKFGKAFQPSDQRGISIGNFSCTGLEERFTLETWVKLSGIPPTWPLMYFNNIRFHIQSNLSVVMGLTLSGGTNVGISSQPNAVRVGEWFHLAGTFENRTAKLYVNGLLVDSRTYTLPISNAEQGASIAHSDVTSPFPGAVDEVRISSIARPPSEFSMQLPPKNVVATATGGMINLSWQNGGGGTPLMRYKIYRGADSVNVSLIDSSTSPSYQDIGLPSGTRFYYRVSAVDSTSFEGSKSFAAFGVTAVLAGEYQSDPKTVLMFHMNETSGSTVSDASGPGNNGTATGTTIVNGRFGKGRKYATSSEYLSVSHANSLNFGTGDYTLESWVNTLGVPDPGGHIFHKRGTGGVGWYTNVEANVGRVSITLWTVPFGPATYSIRSSRSIADGNWHHVSYVRSGLNLRIFIDGALDISGVLPTGASADNDGMLNIGMVSGGAGGDMFKGVLDEVRISNIARSPGEFNLQLPPKNVVATATGGTINLSWQNGGGFIGLLRYKIYRGGDSTGVLLIDSSASASYTDPGLAPGTRYFYRISAVDSTGFEGSKSYAVSGVTGVLLGEYQSDPNTVLMVHMNEPSGSSVSDASNFGNNGTATGTTIVDGRFGKARLFGSAEGVSIPHSSTLDFGAGNFTVEGWIQSLSRNGSATIKKTDNTTGFFMTYHGEQGGVITLRLDAGGKISEAWSTDTVGDGKWHHFAGIRLNNKVQVYVDGVLSGEADASQIASISNTTAMSIGINNGVIDEVRISNKARSPGEFNLQLPPKNVVATALGGTINVSWQNGGGLIGLLRYKIYRGGDSTNIASQDSTIGTSYGDTKNIFANTTYYYRVSAVDSTGFEGAMSYADSARTSSDVTAPTAPVNPSISPSGWTNASVDTIRWTNPSDPSGIRKVWYSLNTSPTVSSPGTSVSISGSSFTLNNTTLGQTRIYFYLEDGAGNKNPANYAVVLAKFDNNKPTITHDSSTVGGVTVQNGSVTTAAPTITASATEPSGQSGMKLLQLEYRKSGGTSPTITNFTSFTGNSLQIPNSTFVTNGYANGVDYRIIAIDSAGNVASSPSYAIRVQTLNNPPAPAISPPASALSKTEKIKAYRLFSVPFDLDDKKPSTLVSTLGDHKGATGVPYVNWRFETFTQEYDSIKNQSVVLPGKAFFFIIGDTAKHLSVGSGKAVNGRVMRETGIALAQGWNLVGNPYQFNVLFDSLRVTAGTLTDRAYYSGTGGTSGWELNNTSANSLFPWQGLALKASVSTTLLFNVVPPPSGAAQQPRFEPTRYVEETIANDAIDWLIRFDAYRADNGMRDVNNLVGMVAGAKFGYDPYDWNVPPIVGQYNVSLYFKNEDGSLVRDIRPVNPDGEAWEMKVITGDRGAWIRLEASGANALPNPSFRAFLIDLDESMAYDLRERSSFRVNSKQGVRNFKVVVGTNEFILNHNDGVELVPTQFKLFANYPNPFNPETIIRYTIPGDVTTYRVTLKVYNVLGQEVATVVNEDQTGGYYEAKFDGRSLNSGVYFCRASVTGASGRSHTGIIKMVLVR